ncbi:FGFR1 oncogene partner 2 homolog isoform X3 [Zootermopsis nevadensis]|uniref:FGFR1 oncogene partner 2 homolog isoform X3 n=1 Tax=Zootermopsis nevadensis TaxID=136037 RepID=UPI000B8E80CC|nr:FGFR1 oncogene partner 2 homolog isoform X3 [Zootermopsis nevadensis]
MWPICYQYQEEVGELNETARQRPHTVLVAGIQQENRHLRELQQENRELRAALEEHQNALELIMSKYRQQVTKLVSSSKQDMTSIHANNNYSKLICEQSDKICEMAAVMEQAAETDDKIAFSEQELISKLTTENKVLTLMSLKTAIFWVAVPCSLVNTDQCLIGAYCLHCQETRLTRTARNIIQIWFTAFILT